MKISEMTNDQACEAIVRLTAPFASICEDPEASALLDEIDNMSKGNMTALQMFTKVLPRFVAFGLKAHKDDLYEIVGALTEKSATQVGKMNFVQTLGVFKESYDDVLAGFFRSTAKQESVTTAE